MTGAGSAAAAGGGHDRSGHHKHMDYVQAIITRLATNSFLLKGWSLTLVSALVGFGIGRQQWELVVAGLIPTVAFWMLDTYYLYQERVFRKMYDAVAAQQVTAFRIKPGDFTPHVSVPDTAFSITLRLFYLPLLAITVVVSVILAVVDPPAAAPSPSPSAPAPASVAPSPAPAASNSLPRSTSASPRP